MTPRRGPRVNNSQEALPLYGSPDAGLAEVAWSYSRRSTLEQCPRRYYYEYFGAGKRTATQEPRKSILHFLKQIQSRHERAGFFLHLAIKTYFGQLRKGISWSSDGLVSWARGKFRRDVDYSRANPDGGGPTDDPYPPVLLSEFYYRDPRADELCAETERRLAQALTTFASDPMLMPFRQAGSREGACVEHSFKLKGVLPCRIEGKVDLAYQQDDRVTIVDWKLGADDATGDDSLQLATYGLWAVEELGCSPDALRICKVFLGSASVVDFSFDDRVLAATRARIMQDAERMLVVLGDGQGAVVDVFTPCAMPAVCRQCSFLAACPAGKEASDA